jgi:hypothetical protein
MAKPGRKRDGKLERWSQFGLLQREQLHPHGRTGSATQYAVDTSARIAVIVPYLASGHTLAETADELILLNFPLDVNHVRRWLKHYIQYEKGGDLRQRRRAVESANMAESIARSVDRLGSSLPIDPDRPTPQNQDILELLELAALGSHGLAPPEFHGISVPSNVINAVLDCARIEQVLDSTTDARLEQALVTAREALGHPGPGGAEHAGAFAYARYQIPPTDLARVYLHMGGHVCETKHTLAQALLARATLGYIDPRIEEINAAEPQFGFLASVDGAMRDLGRVLSQLS